MCLPVDSGSTLRLDGRSPSRSTPITFGAEPDATGVLVEPSGDRYWVIEDGDCSAAFDAATNTQVDFDGDGTGDCINSDRGIRAHFMSMPPF